MQTELEFEWDTIKAETNLRKHGVSFEIAARVFDDPYHIAYQDRIENGEYRWQTLGSVSGHLIVLVAHTVRLNRATRLSGSSVLVLQREMRGGVMSKVRFKRSELPPLTDKQQSELESLSQKADGEIDFEDIAPLGDTFWSAATRGRFYRPVKTQASVRIDADVLEWLKAPGKGYQTRLNAILRAAMMRELQSK